MRRVTTIMLLGGLAALALIDGSAAPVGAEGDGDGETLAPAQVPAIAFLTGGAVVEQVDLSGVKVQAARTQDGGWELTFRNASASARDLDLTVHSTETSGSPIGRMGPMAIERGQERIQLLLAAGATVRHRLALEDPVASAQQAGSARLAAQNANVIRNAGPPVAPNANPGWGPWMMQRFSTWSFTFRPTDEALSTEHLTGATLRIAETPPQVQAVEPVERG